PLRSDPQLNEQICCNHRRKRGQTLAEFPHYQSGLELAGSDSVIDSGHTVGDQPNVRISNSKIIFNLCQDCRVETSDDSHEIVLSARPSDVRQILDAPKDLDSLGEQALSCRSQLDITPSTVKEPDPEVLLQLRDSSRHRRLCHPQMIRGPSEAGVLGNSHEVLERTQQVHKSTLSVSIPLLI